MAEASGHEDIAPVHPEKLHHRIEPLRASARCKDQRGLDALMTLPAVLAVVQAFQISEHVHRRARWKVLLNPLRSLGVTWVTGPSCNRTVEHPVMPQWAALFFRTVLV